MSEQQWVVVAWAPDEFGAAALEHGVFEARQLGRGVLVVNATRGDALVDDRYAGDDAVGALKAQLAESGLPHEIRQAVAADVAEEVLAVAAEVGARLVVI